MQASGSSEEPIFPYHQRLNGTAHGVIGAERQERAESVITRFQQEAEAALAKCPSEAAVAETQSGQLAQGMSTCESNLKNTTGIGSDEHTTVTASEAKLMDAIGTLSRAIVILSKEMSKNPALLQQHIGSNVQSLVTTLGAVIDTFSFSNTDRQKLMALVQSRADSEDRELGASAAAVYKTQSSSILDVLEDMKHKADEELASLHKSETQATVAPAESAEELEDASWAKAHRRFARALELHATDKASPPPAPRQLADASGLTPASPTVTFSPVVAKKPAHLQSDRGSDLETGSHMNDEKEDLPEVGTATSTQQEAEAATAAVTASVAPPPPAPSQSMDASPRTPASPTVPFSTAQAATTAEAAPAEASPPPAPRQLADASPRTPASPTVTFHPVVAKKPAHLQSDSGSDLETGSHMNDEEEDGVDDAASESSCEPLFFMPRTDIDRQPPVLTRENTQQSVTAMHQRVGEMLIAKRGRKPPDEEDLSSPRSVQTTSPPAGDAAVNELEQVPAEPPALEGPTPSELLCSGPLEEKEVEQLELDDDFADWAGIGAQGGGGEQTKEAAEDFLSSLAQAQDSFEDLVLKHKLAARVRIEEQQSEGEASAAEIEDVHHHKDGKSRRKKSEKQRRSVKIEGQTPAAEASDNEGARHSKRHKKDRQSMHAKQEALGNLIVSPSQRHRSPKPNPPDMKAVYAPQGTLQPVAPPRRRSLSAEAPPVPIRRAGSKRTSPGVNHNGPRQHHLAAEAKYVKMALQESEQGGRLYGAYAHLFDELLGSPPRRRAAPQQQLSPAAAAASPAEEDVLRKRRSSNGLLPEVPDREKARNVSGAAAVAKQQQLVSSPSKLMTDVGRSLAGSQSLPTLIRSQ